jgi:hypothetical protein
MLGGIKILSGAENARLKTEGKSAQKGLTLKNALMEAHSVETDWLFHLPSMMFTWLTLKSSLNGLILQKEHICPTTNNFS